jgi:ribosomal protein S6
MDSVNVDLSIDPQTLTEELDEQMRIEDEKRRKMLLDKAKAEAEKSNNPDTEKTEEVK